MTSLAPPKSIVPLPAAWTAGEVVLGEPTRWTVNPRTGVQDGDVVVLLGAGFLGTLMLQLLNLPGAPLPSRVITRLPPQALRRDGTFRLGVDESLTYDDDVHGRVAGAANPGGKWPTSSATSSASRSAHSISAAS